MIDAAKALADAMAVTDKSTPGFGDLDRLEAAGYCLRLIRDHGPALAEALRDAERWRGYAEVAQPNSTRVVFTTVVNGEVMALTRFILALEYDAADYALKYAWRTFKTEIDAAIAPGNKP